MKFLTLVLPFFLFSCKTQLITEQPPEQYVDYITDKKPSILGMGVTIDLVALEKGINTSILNGTIYEDNNADDDDLMIKLSRSNDISFTVLGKTINGTVPLKIWVKYFIRKNVLGIKMDESYEATGAITVQIQTNYEIKPSWDIVTKTVIKGFTWDEKPTIKAIGVTIPVTFIADLALKQFSDKISSSIDKAISQNLNFRKTMEQTWSQLYNPIELSKDYNARLRLQPISIFSTPISGAGKKISFDLAVESIIETNIGKEFAKSSTKNKLPNYVESERVNPDFKINTDIVVDYGKLTDIAKTMIVGKTFTKGRRKVTITDVSVYGESELLIVKIGVSGSVNGIVYCQGKAVYDKSLQQLKIVDFDFELKTKNALLKTANWLMHNSFLKMIDPMLTIPLKEQIQSALSQGNTKLKNYSISKGIVVNGLLKDIDLKSIHITPEGFILSGSIIGTLRLDVGNVF